MQISNGEPGYSGVIDAALEIARKRKETLGQLKTALLDGDTDEAIKLARDLCGIDHEQESHRAN